ncbi:MAG: SurA N-terminal domain-containing protein [Alphaproteobacteria bacterium]
MLNSLRSGSNNIIVKFLLSIVAIALIWGLGDFFKKNSSNEVAIIDNDLIISRNELEIAKKNEIAKLKNFLGDLSEEQIQALNIEAFVLKKLINNKLIEKEALKQNLKVPDKDIVDYIKTEAVFFNDVGKFDNERFHRILAANNIREEQYINSLKNELVSKFLISSINRQPIIYKNLAKEIAIYNNEERLIELVKINPLSITNITNVNETELEDYYNKNQGNFIKPEKRSFSYIILNKDTFNNKISVSEDEIKNEYNENKDNYKINEKRNIYNFIFKSKNEAEDILSKLKSGKSVKELYKNPKEYLIKNSDKANFPGELQDIGFSLNENKFSEILSTTIGYHILLVEKIIPAYTPNYNEIRHELSENIKHKKYDEILFKTIKDVEDEIASGALFEEVANKFSLNIKKIFEITQDDFRDNKEFIQFTNLDEAVFNNDINFISQAISNSDNSKYIIFKVDNIIPSAVEKFGNVRNEIINIVKSIKQEEMARKALEECKSKTNETHDLNKNIKVESANLKRNSILQKDLSEEFIKNIFKIDLNQSTSIYKMPNGDFAFAIIKHISKNDKLTEDEKIRVENELEKESIHDIAEEYINYLSKKYSVKISK